MRRAFKAAAVVAFVAALPFILSACGGGKASGPGKADVAATVNGKEITLGEVDRIVNKQAQAQGQNLSTLQQAAARLQILDGLIQREVVFQRAEKEKTVPTDDEITTFINQQKQNGTVEEWQKYLKENDLTEEQVREDARKNLAIGKLQDKLYGKITIRDQEVVDYFNANKAQYVDPRGVSLADIVADPRDNTPDNLSGGAAQDDAKSETEAKAKIDRLYAQLKSGADFATVAQASSEDQSAIKGGDLGFANESTLQQAGFTPDLIAKFFSSMRVGDITEPIHFPDGRWVIFKLANRRLENKPLSLDDPGVREQIKQALIDQRKAILNEALIRNAMSDATVVNKLAEDMLKDPNMLGGLQQLTPGASPAPSASASPAASPAAASATPAATPAVTAPASTATPAAAAKPTPAPKPSAAATPRPQPTRATPPAAGASPKR